MKLPPPRPALQRFVSLANRLLLDCLTPPDWKKSSPHTVVPAGVNELPEAVLLFTWPVAPNETWIPFSAMKLTGPRPVTYYKNSVTLAALARVCRYLASVLSTPFATGVRPRRRRKL